MREGARAVRAAFPAPYPPACVLPRKNSPMKEAFRYLIGIAGPSGFGSNSTAEEVVDSIACSLPLTAIITGATSGIGEETARVLAKKGLRLVLPARDLKRATEVRERIQRESPRSEIIVLEMDLSSFTSIHRFCSQFLSLGLPLNILINNAGKYCHNLELSEDNFEMTFATNYLDSVFFLASKLFKSTSQGASTTCFVALSTQMNGVTGKYFADCNECPCSSVAEDQNAARKLWRKTSSLVRITLWKKHNNNNNICMKGTGN